MNHKPPGTYPLFPQWNNAFLDLTFVASFRNVSPANVEVQLYIVVVLRNNHSPRKMHTTYSGPQAVISLVFILVSPSLMSRGYVGQNAFWVLLIGSLIQFSIPLSILFTSPSTHDLSFVLACTLTEHMLPKPCSNHAQFPNGHFISNFSILEPQHYNLHTTTTMPS